MGNTVGVLITVDMGGVVEGNGVGEVDGLDVTEGVTTWVTSLVDDGGTVWVGIIREGRGDGNIVSREYRYVRAIEDGVTVRV